MCVPVLPKSVFLQHRYSGRLGYEGPRVWSPCLDSQPCHVWTMSWTTREIGSRGVGKQKKWETLDSNWWHWSFNLRYTNNLTASMAQRHDESIRNRPWIILSNTWGIVAQWQRSRRKSERSRVRSPAGLNMFRRCAPRQDTLLTRALSRPRSKWVPGRTVKACVFE